MGNTINKQYIKNIVRHAIAERVKEFSVKATYIENIMPILTDVEPLMDKLNDLYRSSKGKEGATEFNGALEDMLAAIQKMAKGVTSDR